MQWVVETVSPEGAYVCQYKGEQGLIATLIFESPRRSKVLIGDATYFILDKDGFFRRDVRLMGPSGTVEIAALVGWSGRMWWTLVDDSKIFWDVTAEWNNHRMILRGEEEVLRMIPQHHGKKLAGCEVRGHLHETLWAVFGFYLMVYDARESLETARQWSDLGKGAVALGLEAVVDGLFEAT